MPSAPSSGEAQQRRSGERRARQEDDRGHGEARQHRLHHRGGHLARAHADHRQRPPQAGRQIERVCQDPGGREPDRSPADSDQESGAEDQRAGRAVGKAHPRPSPRVAGGVEQHLQRHERHGEREGGDDRRRARPFGAERGRHQRLGGNRKAQVEGHCRRHHDAHPLQERRCQRRRIVLEARIGGKGDFVQRRHDLGDEDLRKEQRGCVEPEVMDAEPAARNEHVRLTLQEPEQLRPRHDPAVARQTARAAEVEARPQQRAGGPSHQRAADGEQHDGGEHQGPYP